MVYGSVGFLILYPLRSSHPLLKEPLIFVKSILLRKVNCVSTAAWPIGCKTVLLTCKSAYGHKLHECESG